VKRGTPGQASQLVCPWTARLGAIRLNPSPLFMQHPLERQRFAQPSSRCPTSAPQPFPLSHFHKRTCGLRACCSACQFVEIGSPGCTIVPCWLGWVHPIGRPREEPRCLAGPQPTHHRPIPKRAFSYMTLCFPLVIPFSRSPLSSKSTASQFFLPVTRFRHTRSTVTR
jgi:hypothetical protein